VQWKHVVVLAGEDLVAGLNDQFELLIAEALAGMVCSGSGLLQDGIGGDHLTRDQVLADAEMLERALGLGTPQLVRRHFNHTEAICFSSHVRHLISPLASLTPLARGRSNFRTRPRAGGYTKGTDVATEPVLPEA
jgi:hypothetical protein